MAHARDLVRRKQRLIFAGARRISANPSHAPGRWRPPGPEPWEGPFCRLLHLYANCPYRAVFFIFSMASSVFALHRLVAVCRLSLLEKGKKRAKCGKCLILSSLIRATSPHLIAVGQAQIERASTSDQGRTVSLSRSTAPASSTMNPWVPSAFPNIPQQGGSIHEDKDHLILLLNFFDDLRRRVPSNPN